MSSKLNIHYSSFHTALGFMAIAWKGNYIAATVLPENSKSAAEKNIRKKLENKFFTKLFAREEICKATTTPSHINSLIAKIQKHLSGSPQSFSDVPLLTDHYPSFRRKIYSEAQKIPAGKIFSYGELAKQAKSPHAARAVGSAMANNPIPLIIPCHRVLAANGKSGGFTATGGLKTKSKLLAAEGYKTAW